MTERTSMTAAATLGQLIDRYQADVLEHLDREAGVPVIDGLQFQGDVAIIPLSLLAERVRYDEATAKPVGPAGVEVVRGENGGHTHLLVADPGTATWVSEVDDADGMAVGVVQADAPCYLTHPEHSYSGIAPGRYVIRRQREQASGERRMVAD